MLDNYRLENVEQLKAIAKPIRWRMLVLLIENPMTGSQLARTLKLPRNTAHYHLHILEKAGLVNFQEERLNGGIIEHYYRAIAHIFHSDHFFESKNPIWEDGRSHKHKDMLQSILLGITEQAKMDILQAREADIVNRGNFYYSYAVDLTPEQSGIIEKELRMVADRVLEFRKQNGTVDSEQLLRLRYTVLKTPTSSTDVDDLG